MTAWASAHAVRRSVALSRAVMWGPCHPPARRVPATGLERPPRRDRRRRACGTPTAGVALHPTPEADAHGWSEALGTQQLLLNVGGAFSAFGRGERG